MSGLNIIDIIILIIFFSSMLIGFARGLISELVSLITLIAAFALAAMFASPLANAITGNASVQSMVSQSSNAIGMSTAQPVSYAALGISFGLIFAGVVIVGSIMKAILNIAFQTGILGLGNRIFGAAFGFCRGFIINLVIIFLVQLSPLVTQPVWQQSQLVREYQPAVQWLGNMVSPALANLKSKFSGTLQGVTSSFQGITSGL